MHQMHMLRLITGRVVSSLLTLVFVSALVFAIVEVLPGDVASRVLGRMATQENLETLRGKLGLDRPPVERYFHWLGGIVQGDLGTTLTTSRPVATVLGSRVSNTLALGALAFLIYLPLSLIPAVMQATRRDGPLDQVISAATLAVASLPDFLLGTLLLIAFVVWIPIFPASSMVDDRTSGREFLMALALPALTLALVMAAYAIRMLRDNLIEVLDSDYIRMAELNGLKRKCIVWRHALPNALIPTLNITALNLAYLVGGVVVVEKVFSNPGFGSQLVDSLQLRDLPVIESTVMIAAVVYVGANLLADIASVLLNPRLRTA
jgi:peptide/nickel transport system permease protein